MIRSIKATLAISGFALCLFLLAGCGRRERSGHRAHRLARPSASIRNHTAWTDTDGKPIFCHESGISRFGDTFYWYGTSYKGNPQGIFGRRGAALQNSFHCYSSRNLAEWKYEGPCLPFPQQGWLARGTSHRPHVVYNDRTRKYVMWFFCIGTTEPEYPAAMLAVAVADRPTGPFTFLGQRNTAEEHGWGQDLGVFKDEDGSAYLVYDDGHRNLRVDLLTDDYLSSTGKTALALRSDGQARQYEGAAMIRYKGKYLVAGSGVQGWNPTETTYALADTPLGPYREMGHMSTANTWNSQLSAFVHVAESDQLFAVCDQWFRGPKGERVPLDESAYLWLPVSFDPATGVARMRHVEQWDPWK
jgi:hypothetical protein